MQVSSFIGAESAFALTTRIRADHLSYCEQTSVPKAGERPNGKAWNNKGSIHSDLFVGSLTREEIITLCSLTFSLEFG